MGKVQNSGQESGRGTKGEPGRGRCQCLRISKPAAAADGRAVSSTRGAGFEYSDLQDL